MSEWNEERYNSFLNELASMADEKYKAFHSKLVPEGLDKMIGVRGPQIKAVAKAIAKEENYVDFLKIVKHNTYEETVVHGFVIGFCKADIDTKLGYLKDFIPFVKNWAECDGVVAAFKVKPADKEKAYNFIAPYIKSKKEYDVRFAVVFLMDYFITDQYIDKVLKHYNEIQSDKYYINMAVAWGISVCFIKFPEKTMELLKDNNLDYFTYNKSLQKIIESYRVDKDTKDIIRAMKRKKQP